MYIYIYIAIDQHYVFGFVVIYHRVLRSMLYSMTNWCSMRGHAGYILPGCMATCSCHMCKLCYFMRPSLSKPLCLFVFFSLSVSPSLSLRLSPYLSLLSSLYMYIYTCIYIYIYCKWHATCFTTNKLARIVHFTCRCSYIKQITAFIHNI